jgi:hypothetical protein
MRTRTPFLAGLTLLLCSAGTAVAQDDGEAPPQGEEPPAQGNPPPEYAPAPVNPAPPQSTDNALQPPAEVRLGAAGQIAISDDLKIFVTRTSQTSNGINNSSTTYQLRPAVDYFVSQSLAIGAQVTLDYQTSDNTHSTAIGLMPRVSYDFGVSSLLSIWPRLGLGYTYYSTGFGSGSPDTTGYRVVLDVFVPLVFHVAPHFFIGGGPFVQTDLVAKTESMDVAKLTNNGLMSMLGGYFSP